jgi:hypothetical protein
MNSITIGIAGGLIAGACTLGLWFLIPVFLWMVWKYS